MRRRLAEPRLGLPDGPEGGEHLVQRHVRRDLGRRRVATHERLERRAVDRGVLADLERGEVEAERCQLPAQVLDLAPRDPGEAVAGERGLQLGELAVELLGCVIAPGQRGRLPGEPGTGPADALGDEPEALPVRLVREPATQLAIGLGQLLGIAGKARGKRPCHSRPRHLRRDRLHEAGRDRLVPVHDVVGLDPQRPLGHVGRDRRVAVAVAADPRPPAQERRHPRRARSRSSAVGRRSPARRAVVEGGVHRPVQARHEREQRGVEERHRGPHLVERRRDDRPQVGGAPQDRDLLAQPAPDLAVLGRRQARIVESLEQRGEPPQRDKERPPAGLGRVRGEDRRDRQPLDRTVELVVGSTQPPQPADGVGERPVQHPGARGTCAPGQRADPLPLLGEVHQLEVEREGANDGLGPVEVQGGELVGELLALERIVRPAERDHPLANTLDELEQLGAGLLRDDLAQQRPEQADLRGERVAGAGRTDARRLGANCRGRSRVPAGRLPVGHAAVLHGP